MELQVLMWILAGGFTGTWGLCLFFMNRADNLAWQMKNDVNRDISEIRNEILEIRQYSADIRKCILDIHLCMKDHHGRLRVLEEKGK